MDIKRVGLIGKVFLFLFAAIGAISTILTIREKLQSPKVELVADMWRAQYELPFEISTELYSYLSKSLTGKEHEIDFDPNPPVPQTSPFGTLDAKDLSRFDEGQEVNLYYFLIITNNGGATAKDVTMTMPYIFFSRLTTNRGREKLKYPTTRIIDIGDLRPHETVNLEVWGDGPRFPDSESFLLTHANGVGTIRVQPEIDPDKWIWISPFLKKLMMLVGAITIFSAVALFIMKRIKRRSTASVTEP